MKNLNVKLRTEYFFLGLRDKFGILFKPEEEVNKLDLKEGQKILDYGVVLVLTLFRLPTW